MREGYSGVLHCMAVAADMRGTNLSGAELAGGSPPPPGLYTCLSKRALLTTGFVPYSAGNHLLQQVPWSGQVVNTLS